MPFSDELERRILREGQIIALKLRVGGQRRYYFLEVETVEAPNDLSEFSLGAATGLATAGTGWNLVQDSSNNKYLEPDYDNIVYQIFYGISPSYARVYRQYPSGTDRGNLFGVRTVGSQVGYVNGIASPLRGPSVRTEFLTVKGAAPAFNGYIPYAEPSSVNVVMSFYITKTRARRLGMLQEAEYRSVIMPPAGGTPAGLPVPLELVKAARVFTMGGMTLIEAPTWLGRGMTSERDADNSGG
mgnify:CR=1 FL=1